MVRFYWEHILAFAPIINDGTIIGTKDVCFCATFLQIYAKIFYTEKGPIRLAPLRRNITSCGLERYALNSQRSQLFNASKISFQLALDAFIWINLCKRNFNNFSDPKKCIKRNRKRIFPLNRKTLFFKLFLAHLCHFEGWGTGWYGNGHADTIRT